MNHTSSHHDNKKAVSQFSAPQVLLISSKNHEVLAKSKALPPWLILQRQSFLGLKVLSS